MDKILFRYLLFLLLLGTGCTATKYPVSSERFSNLTILQINDVYEIAPLEGGRLGGMARVAALKQQLLSENPNTICIHAGDFLSPSVIGTVKLDGNRIQGAHMVDIMNIAGVDYVTFGNHEFDLDESSLQARLDESRFDWVSTNVKHNSKEGTRPFVIRRDGKEIVIPQYEVISVPNEANGDFKLALLGVTLDFNKKDYVSYEDVYTRARSLYDSLNNHVDLVLAITHLNLAEDKVFAQKIPEIPLLIGGHDHDHMYVKEGKSKIAKADANAKSAYVHRIIYDSKKEKTKIKSELVLLDESIKPDSKVAQRVEEWEDKAYQAFKDSGFDLNKVVTFVDEAKPWDGLESHIRNQETNLGQTICKAMLSAYPGADLAVCNGGSVRIDDYLSGNITEFDLIRMMPFGGGIQKVQIDGETLEQLLNTGRSNKGSGGYLQMANARQEANQWYIGEAILDKSQTYELVITGFLMSGKEKNLSFVTPDNDGITVISEPKGTDYQSDIRKVLIQYFQKQ